MSVFIDWIDIQQTHHGKELPKVFGGFYEGYDSDAVMEFRSLKSMKHQGSFESSVMVRCDGSIVRVSGNVGRFNRRDNLFNYDLEKTISKANWMLNTLGLPRFTKGDFRSDEKGKCFWTGAKFSRIDVTENHYTGSLDHAKALIDCLGGVKKSRMRTGVHAGESAFFGNKRHFITAYIKSIEMEKHNKHVTPKVLEFCKDYGVVRLEEKMHSRLLNDLHIKYLGAVTMDKIVRIFKDHTRDIFTQKVDPDFELLQCVPHKSRLVAEAWLKGVDVAHTLSRSAFYRHRKILLECDIDIAHVRQTAQVKILRETKVVLQSLSAPDWYWPESHKEAA